MGKWKQELLFTGLSLSGSGIPAKYKEIVKLSTMNPNTLREYQQEKLARCLIDAYKNVPYYHDILSQAGVVNEGDRINWDSYHRIPKLTKNIIRQNYDKIRSNDSNIKGTYVNHSGGSTGTPVEIWQDKEYKEWNIANTLFIKSYGNYYMGDRELRLWCSEQDLMRGKDNLSLRIRNKIYGRKELNSFRMSVDDMNRYVKIWNRYKPEWVEAYAQAIYEFALYVKSHSYEMYIPKGIVTSAGTLYPSMRKVIEEVFRCRVFNRYGSREVGGIACSCQEEVNLHLSVWNHYVEVLDDSMHPVVEGQSGKVYVTTLNNRIMPLIRYEIGDIAGKVEWKHDCKEHPMPLLKGLEGREMSVVLTRDGKIIPGEFFIHFIGVVYNTGFIEKFQVIQHDYEDIEIKVKLLDEKEFEKMRIKIENAIRMEMSHAVRIVWTKASDIPNLKSGKYLYVFSELKRENA